MTQISRDDVLALARLSSLKLTDDEADVLQRDIKSILGYVEQLNELDTTGVKPTYQVNDLQNIWRTDDVKPSLERRDLLAITPDMKDDQIKVPKVL